MLVISCHLVQLDNGSAMEDASHDTIQVQLQTLGGRVLELTVEKQMNLADLKGYIADAWQVGPSHQRIIFGVDEPCDLETLRSVASNGLHKEGIPLTGLVILTQEALNIERAHLLDQLVQKLDSQETWVRGAAIRDLKSVVDVSTRELTYVAF